MRMILPSVRERRRIDKCLSTFFAAYPASQFRQAVSLLCRFYRLKHPRIQWYQYLDWGKTAGKTYENGTIHLVHPEDWKRGRKYKSARQWINMVYHEMGHYIYWVDAERKADAFACRMVRGLVMRSRGAAPSLSVARQPATLRKASLGQGQQHLWQPSTRNRPPTRTAGGLTRGKAVRPPSRRNNTLQPEGRSFVVSSTTTRNKRSRTSRT
jgi:hypothetical protein